MGARAHGDTIDFGVKRTSAVKQWDDADAVANLKYSELPGFKGIKLFLCHRLCASMQPSACAKNFADAKYMACVGCPVGPVHLPANPEAAQESMERYEKAVKDAARWDRDKHLACVRCERSGATAVSYVGHFRIVKSSYHLCIGCYNRQKEVEKNTNSKGAAPKKWAHIREAIVTIEKDGERKTISIGLRTGWAECGRFVKQAHEGWTLVETAIDGEIIPQFSLWNPLPFSPWEPTQKKESKQRVSVAERKATEHKERELAAAQTEGDEWTDPEYRPDWFRATKPVRALPAAKNAGEWEDDRGIVWNKMPVAPVDAEQDASDVIPLQSDEDMLILDAWPALEVNPELGLAPFINWLCEDWPARVGDMRATPAPAGAICASVAGSDASVSPAWREVFGDLSEQPKQPKQRKRPLPPLSPQEDEAYRASFDTCPADEFPRVEEIPAEQSEQLADAMALPEVDEPVAEPVREPRHSKKWLKKQQARIEREAHKKAAEKQRAKAAQKRAAAYPTTRATLGAVGARANALAHLYCSLKLT
jgi:hypothetical protein